MRLQKYWQICSWLACFALLAGCALSDEPPIIRTAVLPTATATVPPDLGRPTMRIDLARGAEIFNSEQGCQQCHGRGGEGNGPVAASFTCKMVSFKDDAANRSKALTAWFALVTNGNGGATTCLMPPWKNRFNEQDRWNVTNYIYSLRYASLQLVSGKASWETQCAACHGPQGKGDGPQAATLSKPLSDLSAPAQLINRSDTQLFRLLTQGYEDGSHKFVDQLTEDQRWAVVAYTRALAWDGIEQIGQAQASLLGTPTAPPPIPDTPTLTVAGNVSNGTPNGGTTAGQRLLLRVLDVSSGQFVEQFKSEVTLGAEGAFSLLNVPRFNGQIYIASLTYGGTLQTSVPVRLQTGSGPMLDLSFKVYEPTVETAALKIAVHRIFIDFTGPTAALVQQGFSFSNSGDRIYAGDKAPIRITIPAAARELQTSGNEQIAPDGRSLTVNVPIAPGTNAPAQFSYQLPFEGNLAVIQAIPFRAESLEVYVRQGGGAFIADAGYTRGDPVTLSDGTYESYVFQRALPAGETVRFTVRFSSTDESERRGLLFGLLIAGAALFLVTAVVTLRLNARRTVINDQTETLLRTIAALDQRHEAGAITEAAYQSERQRLKAQLETQLTNANKQ